MKHKELMKMTIAHNLTVKSDCLNFYTTIYIVELGKCYLSWLIFDQNPCKAEKIEFSDNSYSVVEQLFEESEVESVLRDRPSPVASQICQSI